MDENSELFEARWKGVTDLDPEALSSMSLDGLGFAIVAFRAEEVGGTKMTRDGRRKRKDVLHVEGARMLVGSMREQAVQFMAATGPIGLEVSDIYEPDDFYEDDVHPSAPAALSVVKNTSPPPQLTAEVESDDEDIAPSVPGARVLGSVFDYKKAYNSAVSMETAPKDDDVENFDTDIEVSEVQVVGTVFSPGYKHKDKILQKFMGEANGTN